MYQSEKARGGLRHLFWMSAEGMSVGRFSSGGRWLTSPDWGWADVVGGCDNQGTIFADRLDFFAGDDEICGLAGNDRIDGGSGTDRISGGPGDDRIDGGAGDDWIDGGAGADTIRCGPGRDAIVADRKDCEIVRH